MSTRQISQAYIKLKKQGPFPNQVDPWAEDAHYFQQLHNDMIGHFARQLEPLLDPLGYEIGREASLQIAEGREPDLYIQRSMGMGIATPTPSLKYSLAATEIEAEPGVRLDHEVNLNALHIQASGNLITVIELISPGNKIKAEAIADYRARRERLIERGVNVVEIDTTRSVKRLIYDPIAGEYPYHATVFIPGDSPYFIGIEYGQPLKRIAIPLRVETVPIELHDAYTDAYRLYSLASQMLEAGHYVEDHLPFPTLMSDKRRREALEAVEKWKVELARLATFRASDR